MSAEIRYSISELLALFAPSEKPENFDVYGPLGSVESITPVGETKPSFPDLPPYKPADPSSKSKPKTFSKPMQQKQEPKKTGPALISTVVVEPGFDNAVFSWAKKPETKSEQTSQKETAQNALPSVIAPTNSLQKNHIAFEPQQISKPVEPESVKPIESPKTAPVKKSTWDSLSLQAPENKPKKAIDIPESQFPTLGFAPAKKETQPSQPKSNAPQPKSDDSEWPTLGSQNKVIQKKQKDSWGSLKL